MSIWKRIRKDYKGIALLKNAIIGNIKEIWTCPEVIDHDKTPDNIAYGEGGAGMEGVAPYSSTDS
ncbi:hypothetical protein AAV99_02160 [Aurantiacibacter marinus]|uniref:Uncharacterized protein n=1 Tax=Aurantiacibacter marinus TaxID=874156 RepID=A0A0H0XVX8_9SPHN|nr:hypothetical protein AAV99_02160 [Aurantiacibacter marinus]